MGLSLGTSVYDFVLVLATDSKCHLAVARNAIRLHHHPNPVLVQNKPADHSTEGISTKPTQIRTLADVLEAVEADPRRLILR